MPPRLDDLVPLLRDEDLDGLELRIERPEDLDLTLELLRVRAELLRVRKDEELFLTLDLVLELLFILGLVEREMLRLVVVLGLKEDDLFLLKSTVLRGLYVLLLVFRAVLLLFKRDDLL